jgi:quinol-cytochrome oxidoreductase complex cytochrome b subunit
LIALHFWRVRKDGGLAAPATLRRRLVLAWPHLLARELALLLITLLALSVTALLFDAPLEQMANPSLTPNPAKAPWYFLGLQELVKYGAVFGGVVVPGLLLLALLLLPYVDDATSGVGIYFARERWLANTLFTIAVVAAVVLTGIGTFFRGPNWAWVWPFTG